MKKQILWSTVILGALTGVYTPPVAAQAIKQPCVPDKKYDAVMSGARPPAEQACRNQLAALDQSECTDATYKRDWSAFVQRRKARLAMYQVEMDKMMGGNEVANLFAMKAYAETGYRRMDQNLVEQPSACVLKRRTVAPEATDFTPITNNLGLWVAAAGKLAATDNRKAYGKDADCSFARTVHAFQLAEVALEISKKAKAPPKSCAA